MSNANGSRDIEFIIKGKVDPSVRAAAAEANKSFESVLSPEALRRASAAGINAADVALQTQRQRINSELLKEFGKRDAGALAGLREMQLDKRRTGEAALERVMGRGVGGLVDVAADAIGVGLPAMIADLGGKMLANMANGISGAMERMRTGQLSGGGALVESLKSAPVIGGFVDFFDTISGSKNRREADQEYRQMSAEVKKRYADDSISGRESVRRAIENAELASLHGVNRQRYSVSVEERRQVEGLAQGRAKELEETLKIRRGIIANYLKHAQLRGDPATIDRINATVESTGKLPFNIPEDPEEKNDLFLRIQNRAARQEIARRNEDLRANLDKEAEIRQRHDDKVLAAEKETAAKRKDIADAVAEAWRVRNSRIADMRTANDARGLADAEGEILIARRARDRNIEGISLAADKDIREGNYSFLGGAIGRRAQAAAEIAEENRKFGITEIDALSRQHGAKLDDEERTRRLLEDVKWRTSDVESALNARRFMADGDFGRAELEVLGNRLDTDYRTINRREQDTIANTSFWKRHHVRGAANAERAAKWNMYVYDVGDAQFREGQRLTGLDRAMLQGNNELLSRGQGLIAQLGGGRDPEIAQALYMNSVQDYRLGNQAKLAEMKRQGVDQSIIDRRRAEMDAMVERMSASDVVARVGFGQDGPLRLAGYGEIRSSNYHGLSDLARASDFSRQQSEGAGVQGQIRDILRDSLSESRKQTSQLEDLISRGTIATANFLGGW